VKHNFHWGEVRNQSAYRPRLPITPLTVLSVAAIMTRGDMSFSQQPVTLVDTQLGTKPSPFLQQNFGCYGQSLDPWPIAGEMGDYVRAVTFVPPEIQANPRVSPKAIGDVVSSEGELVNRIANQRDLIGLAQLSSCFASRAELVEMKWSRTVTLVVGDAFADAVVFWNAHHYSPTWINAGIVGLHDLPAR